MKTYTIDDAVAEIAAALDGGQDRSETTIRCALNDALDAASKSGFEVADDETGFGYNQSAAVAEVREIIGKGL